MSAALRCSARHQQARRTATSLLQLLFRGSSSSYSSSPSSSSRLFSSSSSPSSLAAARNDTILRARPAMLSFTLSSSDLHSCPVKVELPSPRTHSLNQETLLSFAPFRKWLSNLSASLNGDGNPDKYELRKITITDVDRFGKGKIGFMKLTAEVKGPKDKQSLPGITLLRGPSVALLVLLHPKNTPPTNLHAVLTVQPRIPAASLSLSEIPAGMLDDNGSFAGAAAQELEEEVGLKIPADKLIPLSELALNSSSSTSQGEGKVDGYYTSPGLQDEVITFHAYVHELEENELEGWKGKLTGLRDEGEKITLRIVKFDDLWKETQDAKALCAWGLWKALQAEGKVGVN